jgi:3-oxoisoapionate decarboxylase
VRLGVTSYAFTWEIGVPGFVFPEAHVAAPTADSAAPEAEVAAPERLTALGLLDRAVALGVGVVQVLDNLPLHLAMTDELSRLRDRADALGLALEVGTRGIEPAHLRTYLRVARQLDSPFVRIVVDTATRHPSPDEVVATLLEVVPEYEAAGLGIAIENHDRFPSAVLLSILERIGSPVVGICLDTVNSFGALERPEIVVSTLGPRTISLHVKDFEVRRAPHAMGLVVEGEPAGQGRLDIPWLLSDLRGLGRDPNALLELWTPPEATLAATIAKERRWADESIAYLRTLLAD